ncbi:MAG: 50S ribosomal protein L32 [Myxococcota bacterium]|nr:50S ribosomal protein L32 [Myxococcota bacterium]MDW8361298.1 50S ribosomal protein L32 [Myxococcales bacterium]
MAVPKRKTSRANTRKRRSEHDKVVAPALVACPACGEMMVPHRACPACGKYRGRQVTSGEQGEG